MRLVLAYMAALLVGMAGCGRQSPSGGQATSGPSTSGPATRPAQDGSGPLTIAVIPKSVMREFWKSVHAGAVKAELETRGVQTIWKGPLNENDRAQQINTVENFINQGVSGIVLAPLDDVALLGVVREAGRAGIPVVIMDSDLRGEAGKDFVSFVATDNYAGGEKAAMRLAEVLGGRGDVLMMRYNVGSASTHQREQGFLDRLAKDFPEIRVVSSDQYGGATTESAFAKAESLLNRFPELDGVFCPNDSSAFGMLRALQQSGRAGKVKFVAFDVLPKFVEAMEAGQMHGFVVQDPLNMGYLSVRTLVAHLRGEKVPLRIDTGSTVVTPENLHEPRIRELLFPPIEKYLP